MANTANINGTLVKRKLSKGVFILLLILTVGLNYLVNIFSMKLSNIEYLFIAVWTILFLKMAWIDKVLLNRPVIYYISKIFDIVLSFTLISLQKANPISFLIILLLIIDSAFKERSEGAKVTGILGMASYLEIALLWVFKPAATLNNIILISINLVIFLLISWVTYKIALEKEKHEVETESQLEELRQFQHDTIHSNAEVKIQITDLEVKNKKISKNLARFSTLQQISQVVNSTLDIKELLNLVNDMIIGVIGVKYCTIFLIKDSPEKLSVGSTNIKSKDMLETIREKIALKLLSMQEGGQRILSNNIDPYTYPGAMDRGIECVLFVPITKGGKILGLIIAEHAVEHGMDDDSKKFIESIASQIGVAIENARLYDEMEKLATTDGLTKVYNRMYFQQNYSRIVEEASANNQPLSAMMMDIDFFKKFNDNYGHDFGDEVLKSIAQLVQKSLDSNGMIARYGGEEFIVLFKNTGLDQGYKMAEELRKKIESNIVQHNGRATKVTVSMGVSEFPHVVSNDRDLLKSADEALYQAKEDGRNCVRKGTAVIRPIE